MKYRVIWLNTYQSIILRYKTEDELKRHVEGAITRWPKLQLGIQVEIFDEIPKELPSE